MESDRTRGAKLDAEYVDALDPESTQTVTAVQDRLTATTVADLNSTVPITIDINSSLERATRQMNAHNIGGLFVGDGCRGQACGRLYRARRLENSYTIPYIM